MARTTMICFALSSITQNLVKGSERMEPNFRPECQLTHATMDTVHSGKDASIDDMLQGGNGYPAHFWMPESVRVVFDVGCTQERRDLRALLVWQKDLAQCELDRKNGATNA